MKMGIPLSVVTLLAVLVSAGCSSRGDQAAAGEPIKLSLGLTRAVYSALIGIADDKGFFTQAGLDVSLTYHQSGVRTVGALSRGEVDMATASTSVFAAKIQDDPSLRIVASIGSVNANEVVARKDSNIHTPADLKGKRVGVTLNSTSANFIATFLLLNSLNSSDVVLVDIAPAHMAQAIADGEVDAIASWDLYIYEAKKKLGDNAISWQGRNMQGYHWLLIVKEPLTQHPEAIKRFLSALKKAEAFIRAQGDEARDMIMRKWGYEPEFMRQYWGGAKPRLSLDQSLVVSFEDVYREDMKLKGRPGREPNILEYIDASPLEGVAPRAVTIFR